MMRSFLKHFLWTAAVTAGLAGCYADGTVGVRATVVAPPPPTIAVNANVDVGASADATVVETPYVEPATMVYVGPDVQVIEGYPEPVFFNAGLYWRFEGGGWYSSSWHDRGWGYVASPPGVVVGFQGNVNVYANYHGNPNARVGEVGYINAHPVYPVHNGPPPRYAERPPATRGGPPVRYNAPTRAPGGGYVSHTGPAPGRPGEVGHGPVENRPVENHPVENHPANGYEGTRPVEAGHGPVENHPVENHPANGYEGNKPTEANRSPGAQSGAEHYEGAKGGAPSNAPTHSYQPAGNSKPAPKPAPAPTKPKKK